MITQFFVCLLLFANLFVMGRIAWLTNQSLSKTESSKFLIGQPRKKANLQAVTEEIKLLEIQKEQGEEFIGLVRNRLHKIPEEEIFIGSNIAARNSARLLGLYKQRINEMNEKIRYKEEEVKALRVKISQERQREEHLINQAEIARIEKEITEETGNINELKQQENRFVNILNSLTEERKEHEKDVRRSIAAFGRALHGIPSKKPTK